MTERFWVESAPVTCGSAMRSAFRVGCGHPGTSRVGARRTSRTSVLRSWVSTFRPTRERPTGPVGPMMGRSTGVPSGLGGSGGLETIVVVESGRESEVVAASVVRGSTAKDGKCAPRWRART
jgi:hypothetical protein